jgi:hypothetical protein
MGIIGHDPKRPPVAEDTSYLFDEALLNEAMTSVVSFRPGIGKIDEYRFCTMAREITLRHRKRFRMKNAEIGQGSIFHLGPNFPYTIKFFFDGDILVRRILGRTFNDPLSISATIFDTDGERGIRHEKGPICPAGGRRGMKGGER